MATPRCGNAAVEAHAIACMHARNGRLHATVLTQMQARMLVEQRIYDDLARVYWKLIGKRGGKEGEGALPAPCCVLCCMLDLPAYGSMRLTLPMHILDACSSTPCWHNTAPIQRFIVTMRCLHLQCLCGSGLRTISRWHRYELLVSNEILSEHHQFSCAWVQHFHLTLA